MFPKTIIIYFKLLFTFTSMCVCTIDCVEVAALVVLPSLIPDPRVKVDVTKVIHLAKVRNKL